MFYFLYARAHTHIQVPFQMGELADRGQKKKTHAKALHTHARTHSWTNMHIIYTYNSFLYMIIQLLGEQESKKAQLE